MLFFHWDLPQEIWFYLLQFVVLDDLRHFGNLLQVNRYFLSIASKDNTWEKILLFKYKLTSSVNPKVSTLWKIAYITRYYVFKTIL